MSRAACVRDLASPRCASAASRRESAMVGIPALELGAQLFVHVGVRLGAGFERLVFDHTEPRQERVGLVRRCVAGVVHAHEYSSAATRSP